MKSMIEQMTENTYDILLHILNNPDSEPVDFFFDTPGIDGQIQILSEYGFITDDSGVLNITELGRTVLVEYEHLAKQRKSEHRFQIMQFVVPVSISVLALIVSIISLLLQFQGL